MTAKRVVYRVRFVRLRSTGAQGWAVTRDGSHLESFDTKVLAVDRATDDARAEWERGTLTQVVVHNANGRIGYEHTYGRDPERRKG